MPRKQERQVSILSGVEGVYTESRGARYGDSVLVDGVDAQALRRAHMRAQTTARQESERRATQPPGLPRSADRSARLADAQSREETRRLDVAAIDAAHQMWLHAQNEESTEGTPL